MGELSKNSVSLAGEFAVISQLALRGFDANMTLGNTKSVDILVSDPRTHNMFKIEVKTHINMSIGYKVEAIMEMRQQAYVDLGLD